MLLSTIVPLIAHAQAPAGMRSQLLSFVADQFPGQSEERQRNIVSAIENGLSIAPLDPDKQTNVVEHAKLFLIDTCSNTEDYDEQAFQTLLDFVRWKSESYARMEAITDEKRQIFRRNIENAVSAVPEAVNQALPNVPEDLRSNGADSAIEKLTQETLPRIGNYYYPTLVYLNDDIVEREEIVKAIQSDELLKAADGIYTGSPERWDTQKLSPSQLEYFRNNFIFIISNRASFALTRVLSEFLDPETAGANTQFINVPPDLASRLNEMSERVAKQRQDRFDQVQKVQELENTLASSTGMFLAGDTVLASPNLLSQIELVPDSAPAPPASYEPVNEKSPEISDVLDSEPASQKTKPGRIWLLIVFAAIIVIGFIVGVLVFVKRKQ